MANDQDGSAEFRPYTLVNFKNGKYIQAGGQTATPYIRGVKDLAYNHNTMLARIKHQILAQDDHSNATTIAYVATPINFAQYVIWVPSIPGRTTIDVKVTATTSGLTTFQVLGITTAGTGALSAATASGATATCVVPITGATFQALTLQFKLSGAANFIPSRVYATLTDITTTAIGVTYTSTVCPQDVTMYDIDRPLSVEQVQNLIRTNQYLYRNNMRCILNWSQWGNWSGAAGTIPVSNVGLIGNSATGSLKNPTWEVYYKPRQGAMNLSVFVAARSNTGASVRYDFGFKGGTWYGAATTAGTTVFSDGNWLSWNLKIPVPQNLGQETQHFLQLCSDTNLDVQAISIWEDPASIR